MAIAKAYVDSHDCHTWQGAGCRTYVADERSPTHEFSDNNVSRCFCGPRFSPLSLHAARFRRTATILSPCGPLVASSHAEDNHGDRANWPGLLVRHTRIQFEPQHWRVAICPFYCGDRFIVVTAQYEISWLKPILALVGGAFAAISWRCWFSCP